MAAPSGHFYGVGLRHARVYLLDSNGVPAATSTTVYNGYQTVGAKAYELNIPDARRIAHTGDDQILAQDVLPRLEVSSGTLRVARLDFDVYAVLTSTNEATIGESKMIGYGTSQQGYEPSIAALLYQQVKDVTSGARKWAGYIIPSTQAVINPASLNENAPEFAFNLLPSAATHYPWGIAYASGTEGYTTAEMNAFEVDNLPMISAWQADGVETEFLFDTDMQASSTSKIHAIATIETDGTVTDVTSTASKATTGVTITVGTAADPLDDGTKVVVWYEYDA